MCMRSQCLHVPRTLGVYCAYRQLTSLCFDNTRMPASFGWFSFHFLLFCVCLWFIISLPHSIQLAFVGNIIIIIVRRERYEQSDVSSNESYTRTSYQRQFNELNCASTSASECVSLLMPTLLSLMIFVNSFCSMFFSFSFNFFYVLKSSEKNTPTHADSGQCDCTRRYPTVKLIVKKWWVKKRK